MLLSSVYIKYTTRSIPPGGVVGASLGVLRRGAPIRTRLRASRRLAVTGARPRAHTARA